MTREIVYGAGGYGVGSVVSDTTVPTRREVTPDIITPAMFGGVGDGEADDSVALQRGADEARLSGAQYHITSGYWKHDGTFTIGGADDLFVQFDGNAWLCPTAGWGLRVDDYSRHKIKDARILIRAGSTATKGIFVNSAVRTKLNEPVIWMEHIPTGFVGIDVYDNSYWCTISDPTIRKSSGSVAGAAAIGVRFQYVSNACRLLFGDINHCDVGCVIDGVNSTTIIGTAFEDVPTAIKPIDPTVSDYQTTGITIDQVRHESSGTLLDLSDLTYDDIPIQLLSENYSARAGSKVINPNNISIATWLRGGIEVRDDDMGLWLRNGLVGFHDRQASAVVASTGHVVLNPDTNDDAAGDVRVEFGDELRWRLVNGGVTEMFTTTTPPAPTGGKTRFYVDTSGGKLRLMALFPTGAAQVLATEP